MTRRNNNTLIVASTTLLLGGVLALLFVLPVPRDEIFAGAPEVMPVSAASSTAFPMQSVAVMNAHKPFRASAQSEVSQREMFVLQPLATVSAGRAHSYGSGLAVPSLAMSQAHVARQEAVPVLRQSQPTGATPVLALGYSAATEYMGSAIVMPVRHRAPGHIGGDAQGDATGESVWSQWLDEYWSTGATDLSGLEAWWNGKYGESGYTPDLFPDFQKWATPIPDGVEVLLLVALLYGIIKRKKLNTNLKQTI